MSRRSGGPAPGGAVRARLSLGVALLLLACGPSASDVETRLEAARRQGPGTRVSLAPVVPGATRVFLFGPYTNIAQARRCLGASAPDVLRGLEARDDVNVLVFELDDGELRSVAISRAAGEFVPEAVGRSYPLAEAEFVVRRSAERHVLTPVHDVAPCIAMY